MNPVASPDVELKKVTKRFDDFVAVNDISLTIEAGTFVTLLGPSGCGKTTTLRMIAGFEHPSAGEVLVRGRDVASVTLRDKQTRMVFQSYALFPHMTVKANVAYGLRMLKVPRSEIETRVMEILELIGIPDKAGSYPSELSGGQQQRVALARALVTRPAVLLLDEPLGALDLKMRRRMQAELKKLQREVGITFVYVTHDQEEALALSDQIVVMQDGIIAQRGSPEEIYRRPVSSYVADFIGETNLLRGIAAGGDIIAIRPEHVRIGSPDVTASHSVAGTVSDVRFMGPVHRVFLTVEDGQELRADITGQAPAVGTSVRMTWSETDAVQLRR